MGVRAPGLVPRRLPFTGRLLRPTPLGGGLAGDQPSRPGHQPRGQQQRHHLGPGREQERRALPDQGDDVRADGSPGRGPRR